MEIFIDILLLTVGFLAVIKGADWLVDGASALARKKGISELTIGLTVVALGTSAPELAVNVQANSEIVFGNTIGSNNFNLLCILGFAGLVFPLFVHRKTIFIEIPISILAALLALVLVNDKWFGHSENLLSTLDSIILLIAFGGFLFYIFRTSKTEIIVENDERQKPLPITMFFIIIGILGLILGGHLVVKHASSIALSAGVSDTIIGLTIVSFGTSLPELATSVVAAFKRRPDLAVGNVVGSNIFNLLLILGISGTIRSKTYSEYLNTDILVIIISTLALFVVLVFKPKKTINRYQAGILLLGFLAYMLFAVNRELHFL